MDATALSCVEKCILGDTLARHSAAKRKVTTSDMHPDNKNKFFDPEVP